MSTEKKNKLLDKGLCIYLHVYMCVQSSLFLQVLLLSIQHRPQQDDGNNLTLPLHAFTCQHLPGTAVFSDIWTTLRRNLKSNVVLSLCCDPAGTQPVLATPPVLHHAPHSEYYCLCDLLFVPSSVLCSHVTVCGFHRERSWHQGWNTPCPSSPPQWWDPWHSSSATSLWAAAAPWVERCRWTICVCDTSWAKCVAKPTHLAQLLWWDRFDCWTLGKPSGHI